MDRSPEVPVAAPDFSRLRAGGVGLITLAVLLTGSWLAETRPNSGYQAGYEAVTTSGEEWIRAEVDAAGGTARALCEKLRQQVDQSATEPRYEPDSFVKGCGDAVDHLYGKHVPMETR